MSLPQQLEHRIQSEVDPAFALRARYILERVLVLKPKNILDAGCGRGFYASSFCEFPFVKKIIGIDLREKYLKKARKFIKDKRLTLQQANIYRLPFKPEVFDFIVSSEVMEHLPDDVKALKALHKIVKKGGTLIISVPHANYPFLWDPLNWILEKYFQTHINKNIWWLAGIWADHERLYSLKEITSAAKKAGWKIVNTQSVVHYSWPLSHFWLYGVGKNIVERLGSDTFNRFTLEQKPLSELLAKIVAWPSQFDPKDMTGVSSVDLIVELKK
ncbi:MAG: methyltransferase domain-containing protein [Patescibacteria group bacterium]